MKGVKGVIGRFGLPGPKVCYGCFYENVYRNIVCCSVQGAKMIVVL